MYLFPNMPAHTLKACFPAMLLSPEQKHNEMRRIKAVISRFVGHC